MSVLSEVGQALGFAFAMFWEILWALILGFGLSAIVQAVASKSEMVRLLPDDSPRSLAVACGLGAASSSCSYAAVALARSIFRKGANFTAAMAFEFASTNLVVELGLGELAAIPERPEYRVDSDRRSSSASISEGSEALSPAAALRAVHGERDPWRK